MTLRELIAELHKLPEGHLDREVVLGPMCHEESIYSDIIRITGDAVMDYDCHFYDADMKAEELLMEDDEWNEMKRDRRCVVIEAMDPP